MNRPLALAALLLLGGCASGKSSTYEWKAYEPSLYKFYRDPSSADEFTAKLAEAIAAGERDGKIAPGLYAEYGFMLMNAGRGKDAIVQFEKERQRWPESRVLMDRMIKVAGNDAAVKTAGARQ